MKAFKDRTAETELMDDAFLDPEILNKVLKDVGLANRLLGGNKITQNAILRILKEDPGRSYRIMDVGCGDGEMLRQIALICRRNKYSATFIGLDISETAIQLAKTHSEDFPEIEYHLADLLEDDSKGFVSDLVLCTLTLHHLPSSQIPEFLNKMASTARIAVLVNDLQRSALAYYLFKIFSPIFIKTKIARHDGLVSVKRGFRRKELFAFANQVIGYHPTIEWKWAFRYLLTLAPSKSISHE